jgi:predicted site-specific integrase-resolvase
VEYRCQELKREASLQAGNHNSAITFQELSDRISATRNTLEQYEIACKERRLEINKLNRQYIVLEELVNDFQTIMKNMSKSHKLLKTRWFVFCQM